MGTQHIEWGHSNFQNPSPIPSEGKKEKTAPSLMEDSTGTENVFHIYHSKALDSKEKKKKKRGFRPGWCGSVD